MQRNFSQPVHDTAMRPGLSTSGRVDRSSERRRSRPLGVNVFAVMSASSPERSRILPSASRIAGFSAPFAPYRISFMVSSFFRDEGPAPGRPKPDGAPRGQERTRDWGALVRRAAVDVLGGPGGV